MFIGQEMKDIQLELQEKMLLHYKRLFRLFLSVAQIFGKKNGFIRVTREKPTRCN